VSLRASPRRDQTQPGKGSPRQERRLRWPEQLCPSSGPAREPPPMGWKPPAFRGRSHNVCRGRTSHRRGSRLRSDTRRRRSPARVGVGGSAARTACSPRRCLPDAGSTQGRGTVGRRRSRRPSLTWRSSRSPAGTAWPGVARSRPDPGGSWARAPVGSSWVAAACSRGRHVQFAARVPGGSSWGLDAPDRQRRWRSTRAFPSRSPFPPPIAPSCRAD